MRISLYDWCKIHPEKMHLLDQWDYEKNGELTPKDVTHGSEKIVYWLDKKGHSWQTQVVARTTGGGGCPYCSNQKVLVGYNDLATIHPDIAKEWHPTKNGPIKPSEVMAGSCKKYWWMCELGHSWQTTVSSRTHGGGCPICHNQKVLPGYNDLATTCPAALKYWDYEKNIDITPQEVTRGSEKTVWWRDDAGSSYQEKIFDLVHRVERKAKR